MNIIIISHNISWRGSFFRGFYWGRELVKRGHSVTILSTSINNKYIINEQISDGVKLLEGPDLFSGRLRYDIIHCIDSRPNTIIQ